MFGVVARLWRPSHIGRECFELEERCKAALISIESKRRFVGVSADIMEQVDAISYLDPKAAAMKVLGLS